MNLGGSVKINKCGMLIFTLVIVLLIYYMSFSKKESSHGNIQKSPNYVNLRKLLIGSIQAAQKGGYEVVAVSKDSHIHQQSKGKTLEGANDPVTNADFRSHCVMQRGLQRIFPKLKIISEEDSQSAKCSDETVFDLDPTVLHDTANVPDELVPVEDVTVWLDPLDATQEFTERLYEYVTTMVCVAIKGVATIGVIHNPFKMKTVWAWQDKSMSEDLAKVKPEESKNHIIIVSRSHSGDVQKVTKNIFGDNAKILSAAGAGYKVLQVVFNNATAYIHSAHIKKWDLCAGNAILNALGGKMTDLTNKDITYVSDEDVVHTSGLLATLTNHKYYIDKISVENKKSHVNE